MSGGLLDRLDELGVRRADDEITAILQHMRVLLGTRQGGSASTPGFGLHDITDAVHSYPVGAQQIGSRIRAAIESFEPRLARGIHVELLNNDISGRPASLYLEYKVVARLASDRRRVLVFHACVSPDQSISLDIQG